MANDGDAAEIVAEFFLNSCRLRQRPNADGLLVMRNSILLLDAATARDDEVNIIPLSTGSVAEFYIEPMLSCIGDIDMMWHRSSQLAIPQGHLPPTQLPDEFHGRLRVFEIVDSEFPGYVYLVLTYLLTEITDDGKYITFLYEHEYASHRHTEDNDRMQGPAVVSKRPNPEPSLIGFFCSSQSVWSSDLVPCIRCLSWPSQAADWPTRHRNYGCPDSATVDRVVSTGCDVVGVAHRLCREDEWMGKHQYRLSFSRAEIILLTSWMPVQQIVYHMLRFFMKTESLTDIKDSTGRKLLSNYNIKTLMLWACETKGKSWWISELNVVGICVKLLHILADWLIDARCPHYFINNCNLFDLLDNSHLTQHTANRLESLTKAGIAEWFINNYVRKCVELCPNRGVSRLFDDISTRVKLQNAVSAVVEWRLRLTPVIAWTVFSGAQHLMYSQSYLAPLDVQTFLHLTREWSKIHECLSAYFTVVTFLRISFKIARNPLTDEMLDILSTVCLQSNDVGLRRRLSARHSSVLSLSQAVKLMKVVANNSRNTVQLIEIELSKAYLYRALRCKDSDSDSIYCLANVYLAVLYYTTGQYQKAIDHCTVVTRSRDHSLCSSHVVQGELMPEIDDDIDSVLGLAVLYQYVRTAALDQQQQTQHVSVFSTELFAHSLHIKCQSVMQCHQFTQMSSSDEIQRYEKCFSELSQLFITDIVFVLLRRAKCPTAIIQLFSSKGRTKPVTSSQLDTSELVELLQKSAIEHLTICRHLEAREFVSVTKTVTTDFEALYAYKCGDYQRCFQLSTQNVHTLIGASSLSHVVTYSDFIQLLNDDLVCLTGLTLLVISSCRDDPENASVSQLSLSLYLMTQCQMKLHHPEASLAQTLDYMELVHRKASSRFFTLDQLLLKFSEHKILKYLSLER